METITQINFIEEFKFKAHNKSLTAQDIIARCVFKATNAKSNDKQSVMYGLIHKAFTPGAIKAHRPYPFWGIRYDILSFKNSVKWKNKYEEYFDPEIYEIFKNLVASLDWGMI